MKRLEKQALLLRKQVRATLANWDGVFGLDPAPCFFQGREEVGEFVYQEEGFSVPMAWWLGELCRLAYTPDHRELLRDREGVLPRRDALLRERAPFCEVHSVHKTANHASIYRPVKGEGPTIVCFRGTSKTRQWIMNAVARPHRWRRFRFEKDLESAFVHSGFYVLFKRVWSQMHATLEELPRPWIFTGHSLGGALAMLAGAVAEPDLVCTFGMPKVGNGDFYSIKGGQRVWRLVNESDLVPRLPLPDSRLGDRQFIHGAKAMMLKEGGSLEAFESAAAEENLPFSLSSFSQELSRPPAWIREHRIGEYCQRLREASFRMDA